jgi:hypothetical protein
MSKHDGGWHSEQISFNIAIAFSLGMTIVFLVLVIISLLQAKQLRLHAAIFSR